MRTSVGLALFLSALTPPAQNASAQLAEKKVPIPSAMTLSPIPPRMGRLATVGYGDMHPQTNYGHLIATVEIFTGMSFLAVMAGLIFARFSRPRARFVFANTAVITRHEGRQALIIRTANARHDVISRANARGFGLFAPNALTRAISFAASTNSRSTAVSIRCSF